MVTKIAAVTEDGQKMSSHFGMAPSYRVFTLEDGKIVADEMRSKYHHAQHHDHNHHQEGAQGHGHADMLAPVGDCQVLLCGGMGEPAYQEATAAGLEVVLTGGDIQAALEAYLQGDLTSDMRRVHQH